MIGNRPRNHAKVPNTKLLRFPTSYRGCLDESGAASEQNRHPHISARWRGADQRIITVVAFIIISSILVVRSILTNKAYVDNNLFLTLIDEDSKLNINEILPILQKYCLQVELKRLDESQNNSELTFLVKLDSNSSFQNISDELRKKASSVKISFIESEV